MGADPDLVMSHRLRWRQSFPVTPPAHDPDAQTIDECIKTRAPRLGPTVAELQSDQVNDQRGDRLRQLHMASTPPGPVAF